MISRRANAARLVVLGAVLALAPAKAQTSTPFSSEQRDAIGQVVREYLLKNPEILQEAFTELERRMQESQRAARVSALQTERDKLFHSPHDYVVGNPQGDVTLIEFMDYNCPFCKRAAADVEALIKADPKLRVVLKDFPVLGPDSLEASRVAVAAKTQLTGDKVFEFHKRLMGSSGRVNGERAKAVAREMGLDLARLEKDMNNSEVEAVLRETVALGTKLGVTGTPAFVIGDEIAPGAVGVNPLRLAIMNVRNCGKAVC